MLAGVPFTRPSGYDTSLVIAQTPQEYSRWKTAFDQARPDREKYGIQTQRIYREPADSGMAMVFTIVSNTKLARQYMDSENTKTAMSNAVIDGSLETYWLEETLHYTKPITDSILMFMSFKVMSYDRWEHAFLDDYRDQPDRDFQVLSVLRGIDEPHKVYMLFAVNDPSYVEKMEKNNAFRMKMLASGVISYPVTYTLDEVPI